MKTIVTSEFGCAVSDEFKVKTVSDIIGFKFIAKKFKNTVKPEIIRFNLDTEKAKAN